MEGSQATGKRGLSESYRAKATKPELLPQSIGLKPPRVVSAELGGPNGKW